MTEGLWTPEWAKDKDKEHLYEAPTVLGKTDTGQVVYAPPKSFTEPGTTFTPPTQATPDPYAPSGAEVVRAWEEAYGLIDTTFVDLTPVGAAAAAEDIAHGKSRTLQYRWQQVLAHFATSAGNRWAGALINAGAMNDPDQRAATLRALETLIKGYDPGATPTVMAGGTYLGAPAPGTKVNGPYGTTAVEQMDEQKFTEVVADPSKFASMSDQMKDQWVRAAQQVLDYEKSRMSQSTAIERAMAAVTTGNMSYVLNEDEVAALQAVSEAYAATFAETGGTSTYELGMSLVEGVGEGGADPLADLNVTSITDYTDMQGVKRAVFHLDKDWAKRHPAKAAAVAIQLQEQNPGAKVDYGEKSIVGELFDGLQKPLDLVASPVSALINVTSDQVRRAFDNGDPAELRAINEKLRSRLANAPLSKRDDILSEIMHNEDRIQVLEGGLGEGFVELTLHGWDPEVAGLGFAENIVQGTGLLPGDYGYESAMFGTVILGQFLDPINWMTGFNKGAAAAGRVPKLLDTASNIIQPVRGPIARWAYKTMAKSPEEWATVAREMGAVDNMIGVYKTMGADAFHLRMTEAGHDSLSISYLEQALKTGKADVVEGTLVNLMSSPGRGADMSKLIARQGDIANQLNTLDRLRAAKNTWLNNVRREEALASDVLPARQEIQALEDPNRVARAGMTGEDAALLDQLQVSADQGFVRDYEELKALRNDPEYSRIKADLDEVDERIARKDLTPQAEAEKAMGHLLEPIDDGTTSIAQQKLDTFYHEGTLEDYGPGLVGHYNEATGERWYFAVDDSGEVVGYRHVLNGETDTYLLESWRHEGLGQRMLLEHWNDAGITDKESILQYISNQVLSEKGAASVRRGAEAMLVGHGNRTGTLEQLLRAEVDLKAELAELQSLTMGSNTTRATVDFDIMKVFAGNDKWSTGWRGFLTKVVAHPFREWGDAMPGSLRRKFNKNAKEILRGFRRMFDGGLEGAGAAEGRLGRAIFLPGMRLKDGVLVDALDFSKQALIKMGRHLSVDEGTLARIAREWDELVLADDINASFKWFNRTWDDMVKNSPRIPIEAKPSFGRLWERQTTDNMGRDFVRTSAPGEYRQTEALINKTVELADGTKVKIGQPLVPVDLLDNGVFLPDMDAVIQAVYSAHKGALSKFVRSAATGSRASRITGIWKTMMLTSKMPVALPMRITGELIGVRMAGLGLAGLTNSPIDWFRSVFHTGEYKAFPELLDDPGSLLGTLERNWDQAHVRQVLDAATLRGPVNAVDQPVAFYDAYSVRIAQLASDPEVHRMLRMTRDEWLKYITAVHNGDGGGSLKAITGVWSASDGGLVANATRAYDYVHGLAGSGDAAQDILRALKGGTLDGAEAGTRKFAVALSKRANRGWKPGLQEVRGDLASFVRLEATDAVGRVKTLQKMTGWMFQKFYAAPEKRLARLPAYKQLVVRRMERLTNLGYTRDEAFAIAHASATRDVADWFFKIGAHSSGEYYLKNISPFFPAWRELTDTWLMRIPDRIGGAMGRGFGYAVLAHRADTAVRAGEALGLIEENQYGDKTLRLPIADPITQALFGVDAKFSLDSIFGILPIPKIGEGSWAERIAAVLPGLGGSMGLPLQVANAFALDKALPDGGTARDRLRELLFPYGTDVMFGGNWSKLYTATAMSLGLDEKRWNAPWELLTSPSWREGQMYKAIDGAMMDLLSEGKNQPPDKADYAYDTAAGRRDFERDFANWQSDLVREAELRAGEEMGLRFISSAMLPAALDTTTEEEQALAATWQIIHGTDGITSPMLAQFLELYPEASWMLNSATVNKAKRPSSEFEGVKGLFEDGLAYIREPEEMATWAYGMNTFQQYLASKRAIYAQFEDNPVDYLLNGHEAREQIRQIESEWEMFLLQNAEATDALGQRSFESMLNEVSKAKGFDKGQSVQSISLDDLNSKLNLISDSIEDDTYAEVRRAVFQGIEESSKDPFASDAERNMWATIGDYYDNVVDPYYEYTSKLWDEVNALPKNDYRRGEIMDRIRFIANSMYDADHTRVVDGIAFPSPEQLSFMNKTPAEQAAWAADKIVNSKPEWMTTFQAETLGYIDRDQADEFSSLATFVNVTNQEFEQRYGEYPPDDAKERLQAIQMRQARELGLGDQFQQWAAPPYVRLSHAGLISGDAWDQAGAIATQARTQLERADLSPYSSSPRAIPVHRWAFSRIMPLVMGDEKLNEFLTNAGVGMEKTDLYDVVFAIFFNGWNGAPRSVI